MPEANENIEEEEEENLDDSHDDKAAEQDEEDNPMSYSLPTHHRKTTPYSRSVTLVLSNFSLEFLGSPIP